MGGDVSRYIPPRAAGHRLALLRGVQPQQALRRTGPQKIPPVARSSSVSWPPPTPCSATSGETSRHDCASGTRTWRRSTRASCVWPSRATAARPGQALLPGYDALVQAESGWASLTGVPVDRRPRADCRSPTTSVVSPRWSGCWPGCGMPSVPPGSRRGHQPVRQRARDAVVSGDLVPVLGLRDQTARRCRRIRRWCRSSSLRPPTATSRWPAPRSGSSPTWCGSWASRNWRRTRRFDLVRGARAPSRRGAGAPGARFADLTTARVAGPAPGRGAHRPGAINGAGTRRG